MSDRRDKLENLVITIARGYGSGGRSIGIKLAQELGISYYDRELLRLASRESGINEALFARADEKLKNTLLFKIARNVYTGEEIPADTDDVISNDKLFHYQAKVLKELAERESFVVIGRCADYILRDHTKLLKVYIHAPFEDCVDSETARSSLTRQEVEKFIRATDKHRAEYYQYYTGREWNDARNYDLCLNSSAVGKEQCVAVIRDYIKLKFDKPEK